MRRIGLSCLMVLSVAAAPAMGKTYYDEVRATVKKTGRSGTAIVYKGTVHSKVFGTGKVVEKVYGNLDGTLEITYEKGKVFGTTTAKVTPMGGGKVRVSGTYKLTRGTGKYKGIRGSGTYKGTADADLQRASFTQRGPVTF